MGGRCSSHTLSSYFFFFLLGSLYYFIGLYVKIKIGMFGVLLNGDVGYIVGWVGKIDKVVFGDVK